MTRMSLWRRNSLARCSNLSGGSEPNHVGATSNGYAGRKASSAPVQGAEGLAYTVGNVSLPRVLHERVPHGWDRLSSKQDIPAPLVSSDVVDDESEVGINAMGLKDFSDFPATRQPGRCCINCVEP